MTEEKNIQEEFGLTIVHLIEFYGSRLHSSQIAQELIMNAVSMSLYCASEELEAMKLIMDSVNKGIENYLENH